MSDTPMEIWKDIEDFAGIEKIYSVSNLGRVRSDRFDRILNGHTCRKGYRLVWLQCAENNSQYLLAVHCLVATAFLDGPPFNHRLKFIDGNPLNAAASNLVWVKRKAPTGRRRVLTPRKLKAIRAKLGQYGAGAKLARKYGISQALISRIKNGSSAYEVAA